MRISEANEWKPTSELEETLNFPNMYAALATILITTSSIDAHLSKLSANASTCRVSIFSSSV